MSASHIRRCISGCVRARDRRGIWQNVRALQQRLQAEGCTPTIARLTAQAAAAVAETIKARAT
jgi:hypothetical protein